MATNYTDDVALLKQELAQFLLSEIATTQGGTPFRREVGEQVAAVIDQIFDERLKPKLANFERQLAEQAEHTQKMLDDALRDVRAAASSSGAADQKLADIVGRLEELRQRVGRFEENARPARPAGPAATAQPMRAIGRAEDAPDRVPLAAAAAAASSFPTWIAYVLLLLAVLIAAGVGNLYYEKYKNLPQPPANPPQQIGRTKPTPLVAPPVPAAAAPPVSVPPQNPVAIAPVTPKPATIVPEHVTAPLPHAHVPADIAIERGWLAAQPYAVDSHLARRVGVSDALPTLKTLICGSALVCSSDSLFNDSSNARQLVALQMVMSQIGDRFCTPRRSVAVNGSLTAAGLSDLAAIAGCAGGAAAPCTESQSRICPPDADSLQAGSPAARAALLRWALWKTGSS